MCRPKNEPKRFVPFFLSVKPFSQVKKKLPSEKNGWMEGKKPRRGKNDQVRHANYENHKI